MRVPVHTNKPGLYGLYQDLVYCTSVKPHPWGCSSSSRLISFSNKPPITQGTKPLPTNYWRKAWAVSGGQYELDQPNGRWRSRGDSRYYGGFKTITGGSNFDYPQTYTPPWMEEQAIAACRDELRGLRFLILEEMGQAYQTMSLLTAILKAIVNTVISIRRADYRRAAATVRDFYRHVTRYGSGVTVAQDKAIRYYANKARLAPKNAVNGYLAWRYGVLPLVNTFEALAQDAAKRKEKSKTVKRRLSQKANPMEFTSTTGTVLLSGGAEYTVEVGMTANIEMSSFEANQNMAGLTTWDRVASVWALVPYSFVVDWFIPVQQWLQNQEFTSGIKFLSGYVTRRHTCDATFRVVWGVPYTDSSSVGRWPEYRIRAIHMVRDASIGIPPVPGLVIRTSLTSTRTLDALALALKKVM